MRYISHLDLLRLFFRACRRAKIPLRLSQGFSPHPKISIKQALPLGVAGLNEEATFKLQKNFSVKEFKRRLQKQFPRGIKILACRKNY